MWASDASVTIDVDYYGCPNEGARSWLCTEEGYKNVKIYPFTTANGAANAGTGCSVCWVAFKLQVLSDGTAEVIECASGGIGFSHKSIRHNFRKCETSGMLRIVSNDVPATDDDARIVVSTDLNLGDAVATLSDVPNNTDEFWNLEEILNAHIHGRNEDYNQSRILMGLKPLCFRLVAAQKVNNPVLSALFERRKLDFETSLPKNEARERHAFHGSHPKNLKSLCDRGLLPHGHELNPAKETSDDGWFGSNRKGIYVSRYADYTLKYANRGGPLSDHDRCTVVMLRCVAGRCFQIEKVEGAIDPTPGYNAHSSPNNLEWYLFSPDQCCPSHVLTVEAVEDERTLADDR
eukprot:TRINITY_DN2869_c0_g1_i2.p1 TRINITY_DN2869_c0_g1~~TRINITY_DN2869_c0_g1_i2.p1  ORF type:complete len:348 (+),score=29.98 TRINITY_DN2869_c0_g1_i2:50-1093(+)